MFGGLHIEKALWTVLGRILNSSGWTEILTETEIAGTIDSFLKSSQKTRTWHVHQISALTLSQLQRNAFLCENTDFPDEEKFERWLVKMTETSTALKYTDSCIHQSTQRE